MDKFTRNYSIVLGVVVVVLLAWWINSIWQPDVWEINEVLDADAELADYPYQFRVVRFEDGVAILSTRETSRFRRCVFSRSSILNSPDWRKMIRR